MDSLATLTAVIDRRGMTRARPAKKEQPEAENSENESRETGKLRSGRRAKTSWRHPNETEQERLPAELKDEKMKTSDLSCGCSDVHQQQVAITFPSNLLIC